MSEQPVSDEQNNDNDTDPAEDLPQEKVNQDEKEANPDESLDSLSEEDGLKSAEKIFTKEQDKSGEPDSSDKDKEFFKEFFKYVRFHKKAQELGLDDLFGTTIYQGGVHVRDSTLENRGNIGGGDQRLYGDNNPEIILEKLKDRLSCKEKPIEEIFDKCEDTKQRNFMIALAALNGCNYRIVISAYQKLQALFPAQENTDEVIGISEKKRSEWLEEISAYLDDSYEITEHGKSPIKTVSFINSEAPLSLLSHVWNEHDIYAERLLDWIYELPNYSNSEVQLRAAAVAGQLAIFEFRPVRERILLPWTQSERKNIKTLAALALTVVVYDENEDISQQALMLLHHWSSLRNVPHLHWTAITAYGGYIGLMFPDQALDDLKIIAQSGDGLLFAYIVQTIAELFDMGRQVSNIYLEVLKGIQEWAGQNKETVAHQLSLIVFYGLMIKSRSGQNDINQPILLWLAEKSQDIEDTILFLTRNALNSENTRGLVMPELFRWMQFIDKQKLFYKTFARIIFRLASFSGREHSRIYTYLKRWSVNSDTADQLLTLIKQYS